MSVSLSKGGNVSLTKQAGSAGLSAVTVGLGWDVRTTTGTEFDLDASALLVKADGKVLSDQHFVFYGNLKSPEDAVEHTGDNLTGEGAGDDESGGAHRDELLGGLALDPLASEESHAGAPGSW